jgi:hypothetical protein
MNNIIKLRITDGYSHAEEFAATDIRSFRRGLAEALCRFTAWRISKFPEYQTKNRERARNDDPALHFHVHQRSGWFNVGAYPQAWGLGFKGAGRFPAASAKNLFSSSEYLWDCVQQTECHGQAIGEFINCVVAEIATSEPPKLKLV